MRSEQSIKDMIKELKKLKEYLKPTTDTAPVDLTIHTLEWVLGEVKEFKSMVMV